MILVALAFGRAAAGETVLRWASAVEPLSFDPHAVNTGSTVVAISQIYEPLVDFNASDEIDRRSPSLGG